VPGAQDSMPEGGSLYGYYNFQVRFA
jgi:hypothetical protein